jgi:putative endonuclease
LPEETELCIGGPRASEWPEAYEAARVVLESLIKATHSEDKKHYVYILRCADGTFYTGYTTDPERRTRVHNSGKGAKYTKTRTPIKIVYSEAYADKETAMSREWHIKRLTRAEKLMLIENANKENL